MPSRSYFEDWDRMTDGAVTRILLEERAKDPPTSWVFIRDRMVALGVNVDPDTLRRWHEKLTEPAGA
jgi:hypothetical protein